MEEITARYRAVKGNGDDDDDDEDDDDDDDERPPRDRPPPPHVGFGRGLVRNSTATN